MNQRLRWSPPDVVYTPIDVTSLKYADTPRTVEDVEALQEYAKRVFDVHDAFRNSESARIRGMVDRLVEAAPKT